MSMKNNKNKKRKDIIIIIFCFVASFKIVTGVIDPYIEAKSENKQLKGEIAKAQAKNDELQKSLDKSLSSPETEKGYIRERFHMSEKGELIFVFPDND